MNMTLQSGNGELSIHDCMEVLYTCVHTICAYYRRVPRYIPPPPPPPKKNGPCLNERIFVLVNASAHLFLNSRKGWYSNRILKNSTQLRS